MVDRDWHIAVLRELPERITALLAHAPADRDVTELFVGTGPTGSLYRVRPDSLLSAPRVIASGLGDRMQFGTCEVSALAIHDLDRDGTPELLAATSQIAPTGLPRLYAWSLEKDPVLRGMARPQIQSSWSHALAFLPSGTTDSILSTYCGYGEVVQFQLLEETHESGYQTMALGWQQIAQLDASGEQVMTGDVDNDGRCDVTLCAGFRLNQAALRVYDAEHLSAAPRHVIDEQGRFGNVRAIVTQFEPDGTRELVAWWCTDLYYGECEMIRYLLKDGAVQNRTVLARGDAGSLWPTDTQLAAADADRNGAFEVWFMASSGAVHRYDPATEPPLRQICKLAGLPGAIATLPPHAPTPARIYLSSDRFLLELRPASELD